MYKISCIVEEGIGCKGNDDRALVNRHVVPCGYYEENSNSVLAVVCDGVGGEAYGDVAAEIAVTNFSKLPDDEITSELISKAIETSNSLILEAQGKNRAQSRMASTIAGIYLDDKGFIAFNVGDSRVIRYRKPYIAQLSTDHTLVEDLKELGLEPKPGQEHVITRYLGGRTATPYIADGQGQVISGDIFIICSDGISDVITDIEFEDILSGFHSAEELCRQLIEVAISRSSKDNMSVIIIESV